MLQYVCPDSDTGQIYYGSHFLQTVKQDRRAKTSCFQTNFHYVPAFHRIGPLGRFGLVAAMSVDMWIYLCVPLPCDYFSRPLIGPQITCLDPSLSLVCQNSGSLMRTLKTFNLMMVSLMRTLKRSNCNLKQTGITKTCKNYP